MKTPHKHANLLRAIADGKQMQRKECNEWVDSDHETALAWLSEGSQPWDLWEQLRQVVGFRCSPQGAHQISEKKVFWVAYTNTDLTEGRGRDVPIAMRCYVALKAGSTIDIPAWLSE